MTRGRSNAAPRTARLNPPLRTPVTPISHAGTAVRIIRVPNRLQVRAAERLVTQTVPNREAAARRMLAAAPAHGIDLDLMWASVDGAEGGERVRQACLAVPGAGRTMMLFVSEPPPGGDAGGSACGESERSALFEAACGYFASLRASGAPANPRHDVRLAQALPEPQELAAAAALSRAGFVRVGELMYMRRPFEAMTPPVPEGWPSGVSVVPITSLGPPERQDATLLTAMDSSYLDTLDCPELCGLRDSHDVLASHKATGIRDPALWFVAIEAGIASGCMLLSPCTDQRSVELVYLGLAPSLRGRGIATRLLAMGIQRTRGLGASELTCAVDARNTPAISLYERFGFRSFARRVAFVKPV